MTKVLELRCLDNPLHVARERRRPDEWGLRSVSMTYGRHVEVIDVAILNAVAEHSGTPFRAQATRRAPTNLSVWLMKSPAHRRGFSDLDQKPFL